MNHSVLSFSGRPARAALALAAALAFAAAPSYAMNHEPPPPPQDECAKLEEQLRSLRQQVESTTVRVRELDRSIREIKESLTLIKLQRNEVLVQIEADTREQSEAQEQLAACEESGLCSEGQVAELKARVEQLSVQIKEGYEKLNELSTTEKKLKNQLNSYQNELNVLREQLAELSLGIEKLTRQLEECQQKPDTTPPSIQCPPTLKVAAQGGMCGTDVALVAATATDDSGTVTIKNDYEGTFFKVGKTALTWYAVDPSGNTSKCEQIVVVFDQSPPRIECPKNVLAVSPADLCLAKVEIGKAVAKDDCSDVKTSSDREDGAFGLGDTTVTWTAVDENGNQASCTQTVTVISGVSCEFQQPVVKTPVTNKVRSGQTLPHKARARDCAGLPVTGGVTASIDIGQYIENPDGEPILFLDIAEAYNGAGLPGGVYAYMADAAYPFHYNLNTSGYAAGTAGNAYIFQSRTSFVSDLHGVEVGVCVVKYETK